MKTCLFCQIIQKQIPAHIVAEDKDNNCLGFLDIDPASEGHTLLITKKHFANLSEVEEES
jgi:histidine triad (HIT) family protein